MSVLVGVLPQVDKFEKVSSDDDQMSVAGEVGPQAKKSEQVSRSDVLREG